MKDAAIITIIEGCNFGNRLQNYAVQEVLKRYDINATTIRNVPVLNEKNKYILRLLKYNFSKNRCENKEKDEQRQASFTQFNKNIKISKNVFNFYNTKHLKKFEYIFVGSDQIWNPYFGRLRDFELLAFTNNKNKIAFSASFGVNDLPEEYKQKTKQAIKQFKAISVREDAGKNIVEELTERNDVEVLVDPTMLLEKEEWDKVAKKPKQLKTNKYILNYFLGEVPEDRKKEIDRIAKENNCEIINILDKNDPFYKCGPSEFLYLEKNAFLVCTDSFHSCVFAILYNTPFVVFNRADKTVNMNSRIETLLNKFKLQQRFTTKNIYNEMLECDYFEAYKILEKEREKANAFLKKAIN